MRPRFIDQKRIKKGQTIHLRQLREKGLALSSKTEIPAEMRSEEYTMRGLDENESTISGNSQSLRGLKMYNNAHKALSGKPSVFQQTRYLDEIEEILIRRKKQKNQKAVNFLNQLELKKSEAIAHNLLKYNKVSRQEGAAFEQQINQSRKLIMKKNQDEDDCSLESQYGDNDVFVDARYDSLTEVDEYSDASEPFSKAGDKVELKSLNKQKDQVFFEFFSMYTKESVKAQRD